MPEPKFVIAVGSCALSGGIFHNCYNCMGGIENIIPVDVFVPGCPPRPEALIDGVVKLLQKLDPSRVQAEASTELVMEEGVAHGSSNGAPTAG